MGMRMIKSFALAVGLLFGITTGAVAVTVPLTVDTVSPVSGGATISDPTGLGFLDSFGFTFSGAFGTASGGSIIVPIFGLQTTGSVIASPVPGGAPFGNFIVTDTPPIPPVPDIEPPPPSILLAGILLDFSVGFSTVDMLFTVTDGVLASAFGNLVLVSVFNEPVLQLASSSTTQQVQAVPGLTITSVELTAVPVPAALPLLLTGIGALVALRRKKKAEAV